MPQPMNKKKKLIAVAAAVVVAAALFWGAGRDGASVDVEADGVYVSSAKTAALQRVFDRYGYDLTRLLAEKRSAPRLFVRNVPIDFNRERFDAVRPSLFFEMMLPVVLKANAAVLKQRDAIAELKKEFDGTGALTAESRVKLDKWVERYDVRPSDDLGTLFAALLVRVDAVPPTIMMTMAAQDSGFATSRYAREYNAVYHQRDWDGRGVVPDEDQKYGPQYRIRTFETLYDAVESQIFYVNTSGYLESFRDARASYRRSGNTMYGGEIAHLLLNFPYKPFKYPDIIRQLIDRHGLLQADFTPLDDKPPAAEK